MKVDMDEMVLTAAESKATYQEIREWVQEKYGFHVTCLNIAKTRRKCGIIERQNYNLPKGEDIQKTGYGVTAVTNAAPRENYAERFARYLLHGSGSSDPVFYEVLNTLPGIAREVSIRHVEASFIIVHPSARNPGSEYDVQYWC